MPVTICTNFHLSVVAYHAYRMGVRLDVRDGPDDIGLLIHDANVKAFRFWYGDAPYPQYRYDRTAEDWVYSTVRILSAIDGTKRQCRDHPNWKQHPAKEILDRTASLTVALLPGYRAADWEFDPTRRLG